MLIRARLHPPKGPLAALPQGTREYLGLGVICQQVKTNMKPYTIPRRSDRASTVHVQHLYAGHSLRIGVATTAAMAGVEDAMIQTLGRWQSAAYVQYVAE